MIRTEKCGNPPCFHAVADKPEAIRYDGFLFCSTACRTAYSAGTTQEESGMRLFQVDQAGKKGRKHT